MKDLLDEQKILSAIISPLKDQMVEYLQDKLDNIDLETQSASQSVVEAMYVTRGLEAEITFSVKEPGKISGTQIVDVQSHNREGNRVQSHQREYVDQRVFKLPDGEYITSETIPDAIIEDTIKKALDEGIPDLT